MEGEVLSTSECARRLGVNTKDILQAIHKKQLSAELVSAKYKIRESDLLSYQQVTQSIIPTVVSQPSIDKPTKRQAERLFPDTEKGSLYVNKGPLDNRCQYIFTWEDQINWAVDNETVIIRVFGKLCGLECEKKGDKYCYWHTTDTEKYTDPGFKEQLERMVAQRAYLGGAFLTGGAEGSQISGSSPGRPNLNGAVLTGAQLPRAYMPGLDLVEADLSNANLEWADLQASDLTRANLYNANLNGTNLREVWLTNAKLSFASFNNLTTFEDVDWGPDYKLSREKDFYDLRSAITVYRNLKQHRQNNGDYRTAGEFYFREMECIRKQLPKFQQFLWALFYKSTCGYGERPTWSFGWALAVVLVWGCLLFPLVGVHNPDETTAFLSGPPSLYRLVHNGPRVLVSGLSLSLITFTTLGYGNRYPSSPLGEIFAGMEAILGMLLISLFVISFAKKIIR
jgi:hypothetical protein